MGANGSKESLQVRQRQRQQLQQRRSANNPNAPLCPEPFRGSVTEKHDDAHHFSQSPVTNLTTEQLATSQADNCVPNYSLSQSQNSPSRSVRSSTDGKPQLLLHAHSTDYILPSFDSVGIGGGRPPLSPLARPSSPIPMYSSDFISATPATPVLRSYRMHMSSPRTDFNGALLSPPSCASFSSSTTLHTRFMEINGQPAGLENYGNTCYCNAVLQLLYHCTPLRLRLLELHDIYLSKKGGAGFDDSTLLAHVSTLFAKMHKLNNSKKLKKETVAAKPLLLCVKQLNSTFNNNLQHDAHEFAMFLLSSMIETETLMMTDPANRALFFEEKKSKNSRLLPSWGLKKKLTSIASNVDMEREINFAGVSQESIDAYDSKRLNGSTRKPTPFSPFTDVNTPSPLHVMFSGQFASLWGCLECDNVVMRGEAFVDLSLDINQGCSLRRCVEDFSTPEVIHVGNKLRCDRCKKSVWALKSMRLHRLPEYALLVHLKRFHYDEKTGGMGKKSVHVALPREMDVEEYAHLEETDEWGQSTASGPEPQRTTPDPSEKSGKHTYNLSATVTGTNNNKSNSNNNDKKKNGDNHSAFTPVTQNHREGDCPNPSERLLNKMKGTSHRKARFALNGFVTHIGEGPNIGHYFTCVRHGEQWRKFDDNVVTDMTERDMQQHWGVPIDVPGVTTSTAYILLYERVA